MHSFLWQFDFVDVTEVARESGCNFDLWFSSRLWEWCTQQSPRGPRFQYLTREGGIAVSLNIALQVPQQTLPQVFLVASVGTRLFVNVVRLPDENGERRFAVMLPNERYGRFIGH